MGLPVIITPAAQEDLGEIVRYIAKRDALAAKRFGDRLIDTALSLGEFPDRGRMISELKDRMARELVCGSYLIVYRHLVEEKVVQCSAFGMRRAERLT